MKKESFSYVEMKDLLAPLDVREGETVHIHHCKEGNNNNRLYITNKGDCYLFYCHHCGKSGKLTNKFSRVEKKKEKPKEKVTHSVFLPTDLEYDPLKWPVEARLWPLKASLSNDQIKGAMMGWSPSKRRVYVPINFAGEYRGYVARRIDDDDSPKYITKIKDGDKENFIFAMNTSQSGEVVLVEDILSCLKLYYSGYNSIAILSSNIDNKLFNYIIYNYNKYIIWLDNDNTQVKLNQISIKNRLDSFGETRIVKTDKDPKEHSKIEIDRILTS
jgi:DNA primase